VTIRDLQTYVWRRLGVLKFLVGRAACDDLVQLAVENWAGEFLKHAQNDNERQVVAGVILQNVKRAHQVASGEDAQEYGVWWVFVLQAVASAVVQLIIKWWLDRRSNRVLMAVWKQELTR
jgi:hypothetical protein